MYTKKQKFVEKLILKIIKENKIKIKKKITPNSHLIEDLNMDSYALAQLTVLIEDKYGVDIYKNKLIYKVKDILNQLTN